MNSTINMKKHIFAIPADAPAIPPKPNTPAINAITTNVITQRNIIFNFKYFNNKLSLMLLEAFNKGSIVCE